MSISCAYRSALVHPSDAFACVGQYRDLLIIANFASTLRISWLVIRKAWSHEVPFTLLNSAVELSIRSADGLACSSHFHISFHRSMISDSRYIITLSYFSYSVSNISLGTCWLKTLTSLPLTSTAPHQQLYCCVSSSQSSLASVSRTAVFCCAASIFMTNGGTLSTSSLRWFSAWPSS